jgi:hypothetical protein
MALVPLICILKNVYSASFAACVQIRQLATNAKSFSLHLRDAGAFKQDVRVS